MNGLKVFLVILFLIGIVFLIGTALGSTHSDDQNVQTPGWLSNLGANLVVSQPLKLSDLSSAPEGCLQQEVFIVAVGSSCEFAIKQATFIQRVATVQIVQGTSATITLMQEKTLPVQESLSGAGAVTDANLKVYPGKAHGVLDIQCLKADSAPACLLKLK
jgi:hypothetical protein